MPLEATGLRGRNLRGKWAEGGQVNTPLPVSPGRKGRVLARPTSHPKLLSRPQAVPTFLDLLVHLAWLCPSPRGGGGLQLRGNAISRSPARGRADHEKLSPSRRPLARPEPSWCLRVPGGNRVASHHPRTGDGPGRGNGWEVRGSAEPSRLWATEETGQAWLRGRGGGAPHSQGAGPEPFSLLGAGAPSGVRDFSPTPSRPRRPLSVTRRSAAALAEEKVKVAAPEVGRKIVAGSGSPRHPRPTTRRRPPPRVTGIHGALVPPSGAFPRRPGPDPDSVTLTHPLVPASSALGGAGPGGTGTGLGAGTVPGGRGAARRPPLLSPAAPALVGMLIPTPLAEESEALFLTCPRPRSRI